MKLARTRAAEDEIFDQWGLGKSPQQAETENPPPGGIFCFVAFLIKKALLAKERKIPSWVIILPILSLFLIVVQSRQFSGMIDENATICLQVNRKLCVCQYLFSQLPVIFLIFKLNLRFEEKIHSLVLLLQAMPS